MSTTEVSFMDQSFLFPSVPPSLLPSLLPSFPPYMMVYLTSESCTSRHISVNSLKYFPPASPPSRPCLPPPFPPSLPPSLLT